jgi:hypothetical protein
MVLPTYNAIQFHSKEEHLAALYDACLLIVNTYNGSDLLDGVSVNDVTAYDFMKFARQVVNEISELGELLSLKV